MTDKQPIYAELPDWNSGDEPIWEAIFRWQSAKPGHDASKKSIAVEQAIVSAMRAYADATHALRTQALAAQAPQPTNTKTHDLLSTMIGMFLGFKEKIGYKPGSVIDKVVAEAVEHLKDWPYPEPAPKAPQQAAPAVPTLNQIMAVAKELYVTDNPDEEPEWAALRQCEIDVWRARAERVLKAANPTAAALSAPQQAAPAGRVAELEDVLLAVDQLFDNIGDLAIPDGVRWGKVRGYVKDALAAAPQQEAQEPTVIDRKTMELAESVGLIGPASRVWDLHAAIQRFHDLICVDATIKAAVMAADAIRGAARPSLGYPPLPMQFACSGVFPVYSADQMRAYVDADRAVLAAAPQQAAPAEERRYIGGVRTVAHLVNNLLLLDQSLPIYAAQHIQIANRRRTITVPPTVSRERVKDERWIGEGEELNAAVIWTRAEAAPQQEVQEPTTFHQVYRCKIKSRKQIDKEIPREQQGWWADVSAGQTLLLRQAVQSDLDRCTLGGKRSKNPDDYMCETHTSGSLVSKIALEYMNPVQNVFASTAQPAPSGDAESLLRDAREALWQPSNPEICKRIDNFLDAARKEDK